MVKQCILVCVLLVLFFDAYAEQCTQQEVFTYTYNVSDKDPSAPVIAFDSKGNFVSQAVSNTIFPENRLVPSVVSFERTTSSHTGNVDYWFSNDGGKHWYEAFLASRIPFRSFGETLHWRITSADANAFDVSSFQLRYQKANRAFFTRSGLAAGEVLIRGRLTKVVYSPSFAFPGWNGDVRAWNVSALSSVSGLAFESVDASSSRVQLLWNKNDVSASEPLYTSLPAGASGGFNTVALDDSFASSNPSALGFASPSEAVNFVGLLKRGLGSGFRMRDAGHGTPVFMGPPKENASVLSLSYKAFVKQYKDRRPVVFTSGNEGVVRAFAADRGDLFWEYIPHSVLGVLKTQIKNGAFDHQTILDGPLLQQDVFVGTSWRSVLFVALGEGRGTSGKGFYQALDVTNPLLPPVLLWEYSGVPPEAVQICSVHDASFAPPRSCASGHVCCLQPGNRFGYCAAGTEASGACALASRPSVLGDTFSKPNVAKIKGFSGEERSVVLFGSGSGADIGPFQHATVSVLDAGTGARLRTFELPDVSGGDVNPNVLPNAIVGGVALADADGDGFVDRAYMGDLQGRLWKIAMSEADVSRWDACVLFDAGKNNSSDIRRVWAPIGMTPAVSVDQHRNIHVFFGTGGHDDAPAGQQYQFFSVRDEPDLQLCPASPRYPADLRQTDTAEWRVLGDPGDRFSVDPVLVGNGVVYFSTLVGFADSVETCVPDNSRSKIYARAVSSLRTLQGVVAAGASVFGATKPFVQASGRVRSPVVVFQQNPSMVARPAGVMPLGETDVYVQNTTAVGSVSDAPLIQRITQPALLNRTVFRMVKWREVQMP